MHALLGAACVLVGWPVPIRALAFAAVVGHGILRRPGASPRVVHFSAEGRCAVPEWNTGARALGPRTLVCPFWVRLDLGMGPWRRDILLIADQMQPDEWRRLRALLLRSGCK